MAQTVTELRNEIRVSVGRFEREVASGFTKETLAAICEAVGYDIDQTNYPPKPQMRAGILHAIGVLESDDPDEAPSQFRKAHLSAIAGALREE